MKQKLLITLGVVVASFFLFGTHRAEAATISVATGSDTVAVNSSCSLTEAITNLNNQADTYADCVETGAYGTNDTINLPAGTINLTATLPFIEHSVTVQGQSRTTSFIDAANQPFSGPQVEVTSNNMVITFQDFSVSNVSNGGGNSPTRCVGVEDTDDFEFDYNATIRRMNFTNCNATIFIASGTFGNDGVNTSVLIDSVNVVGPGFSGDQSYGFYGEVGQATVSNSSFTGITQAIYMSQTDQMTVTNSTFSGNGAASLANSFGAINYTNNTIVNNTFGIIVFDGSINVQNTILSNVCDDATATIIFQSGDCASLGAVDAQPSNCVSLGGGTFTSLGNNLASDDCLGSMSSGNDDQVNVADITTTMGPFTNNGGSVTTRALLAGSPAIDAGATVGGITADARGIARPQGTAYDIGAFECNQNCSVTPGNGGNNGGGNGNNDGGAGGAGGGATTTTAAAQTTDGKLANTGIDIRIVYVIGGILVILPIALIRRRRYVKYVL